LMTVPLPLTHGCDGLRTVSENSGFAHVRRIA
uniref:Transcriptional regulator n=1 Tax=Haemonchus placei TaxID=6290 RepID=A0A0N4X6I0_HAEPC